MSRTRRALRSCLLALVAAALVSACGFRPRGSVDLPADLRTVYVEAPIEIGDELAIFLDAGGAKETKTSAEADAVLRVQNERYEQRVVAVDATTGKAREYELLYTLDFSIRKKDGSMLVSPEHVVVRRIYVFDPTQVLGDTNQIEQMRRDMRVDAAERIIRITESRLSQ